MILLDPDLSPHGRGPARGDPVDPDPDAYRGASNRPIRSETIDGSTRLPTSRTLARFLREAQAAVRLPGQVSVLLTTDRNIRRLNRQFRGKDKATDVLSFPAEPLIQTYENVAGDLAISVPMALRQAREQGHALAAELKVLILHGLLHLAGYDHERDNGEMARRERLLRSRLRLPQGLIERSGDPTLSTEASREDGARKVSLRGRRSRNAGSSTPVAGATSAQDDGKLSNGRSRGRPA